MKKFNLVAAGGENDDLRVKWIKKNVSNKEAKILGNEGRMGKFYVATAGGNRFLAIGVWIQEGLARKVTMTTSRRIEVFFIFWIPQKGWTLL